MSGSTSAAISSWRLGGNRGRPDVVEGAVVGVETRGARLRARSGRSFHRTPTTTQSAVFSGFTFTTASRVPGRYGRSFASRSRRRARAPRRRRASAPRPRRSFVVGESVKAVATSSSSARRSESGFDTCVSPFHTSTSNAMNEAGISAESRRILLSAGCRRICIASKSSASSRTMTISPSSAERGGRRSPSGASSGK